MSETKPESGRAVQFYLSGLSPCPYLPGREERKLFMQLAGDATDSENCSVLIRSGFRRSHNILYKPSCPECRACTPVRVSVSTFRPSRSLRRIAARNRDLTCRVVAPQATEEHYDLFKTYQTHRHSLGEMANLSFDSFTAMLTEGVVNTHLYELRDGTGLLMGAMIVDHVQDGASALYSYFRPDENRRSLGTQLILSLLEMTKRQKKLYVYLGYLIEAVPNMAYKARFRPQQHLIQKEWKNASIKS